MQYFVCAETIYHPAFPQLALVRAGDVVNAARIASLRTDGVDCILGYWCDTAAAVNAVRGELEV